MREDFPTFDPDQAAFATGIINGRDSLHWLRAPDPSQKFPKKVRANTALELLDVSGQFVLARAGGLAGWLPRDRIAITGETPPPAQPIIVRTYRGSSQAVAARAFQAASVELAKKGYHPVSQSWAPGSYSCGAFLGALVLAVVVIGILIFLYMLFVKPAGTLTVTYEYRAPALTTAQEEFLGRRVSQRQTKRCPRCAEDVMAEATTCRFCGHEFDRGPA